MSNIYQSEVNAVNADVTDLTTTVNKMQERLNTGTVQDEVFSPFSYKLQDLHFSSLSSFHEILILFHRPDDNLGCKGFHNRPKYLSLFNCPSPCPFSLLSLPLPPTNQLQAGTNNSKHFLYLKNKIRQILYC